MSNLATLPVDEPALHFPGGRMLGWTTWESPTPIRTMQLIVFTGPDVFVVTAMAAVASFERYESAFRCAARFVPASLAGVLVQRGRMGEGWVKGRKGSEKAPVKTGMGTIQRPTMNSQVRG